MGAANKRGTFEERKAMALQRNASLATTIQGGKNEQVKRALKRHGPQRLATMLTAAGMLYAK